MNYTREIVKAFKARGLTLSVDASKALSSVLSHEEDLEVALINILEEIKERIEKREIKSSVIDGTTITNIIADLSSNEEDLALESTQLINAYSSPRLEFDEKQRTYKIDPNPKIQIHGDVESRARMYRERLLLIQQRLLRSGNFSLRGMSNGGKGNNNSKGNKREISSISALLGGKGIHTLLGFLTQPEHNSWYLEDFDAVIPLDFTDSEMTGSMLCEGCVALVQGTLTGGIFRVQAIAAPPAEERMITCNATGLLDVFGKNIRPAQWAQMEELERAAVDTLFVILSDLQLDRPTVSENLQRVFEGFEPCVQTPSVLDPDAEHSDASTSAAAAKHSNVVFILLGPFAGKTVIGGGGSGNSAMESALNILSDCICACPRIRDGASFVLVPAWEDKGTGSVLPLRQLPNVFVSEIRKKVPRLSFATNPCRIRFFTQEIVVFREELVRKVQRHSLGLPCASLDSQPNDDGQMPTSTQESDEDRQQRQWNQPDCNQRLVKCLFDQGHLFPLPASSRPTIWDLDHTLRLFPIPHLLILSEGAEQFSYVYKDSQVVNPGSFSTDFSFVVYRPATMQVEFSSVR